jgi:hypothetical protein
MISNYNNNKRTGHDQDYLIALQIQYDDILDQKKKTKTYDDDDDYNDIEVIKKKLDTPEEDKHLLNPELELIGIDSFLESKLKSTKIYNI